MFNIEKGGFDFIQKYTGYVSPGIFALFILGMFWKRTTTAAALVGMFLGFFLSIFFNDVAPYLGYAETPLYTVYDSGRTADDGSKILEIPYLICMGWAFAFTVLAMVLISLFGPRVNPKAFDADSASYKVTPVTGMMIAALLMILVAIYVRFW
jgi:SSS family solute:Na+ symporter